MNAQYQNGCKVCLNTSCHRVIKLPFDDERVSGFIKSYYRGNVDFSSLPKYFQIERCDKCGFLWQTEILDRKALELLYNNWIDERDSQFKKFQADRNYFGILATQAAVVGALVSKNPARIRVMDFGMGWGTWCLAARAFGYETWGVDISKRRRNFVRHLGIKVVARLDQAPDGYFDFINLEQVLEHVDRPREILTAISGKLTPGGYVYIAVPDGQNAQRQLSGPNWKADKGPTQPLEHINIFDRRSLIHLANNCGLKPTRFPFLVVSNANLWQYVKALLACCYRQKRGTCIYFRKQMVPL